METNLPFPADNSDNYSQQMIKTGSANSSTMAFSSVSPRPQVAFPSDYPMDRPHQTQQSGFVPEKAYSYTSSSASSSPIMPQAVYTPKRPSESPTPDVKPPRQASRSARAIHNRPGGRPLGSHLLPGVAADANRMRKVVACWHCVLQRDKVRFGSTIPFNSRGI
jgi:hypothetical protein